MLIRENEFDTEEKKLDILDRFKDALSFLKNPHKRADKLLKAIYLANIVKIEFKMFNSNNYSRLLKMVEDCISLKLDVPQGCGTPKIIWLEEILSIKLEIEKKIEQEKINPKQQEQKLKQELKYTLDEINCYYKKGKLEFLFYILKYNKPIGLEDDFVFDSKEKLGETYFQDAKKFMKKMRRLYNPVKYKGDKDEEQKNHRMSKVMQRIKKNQEKNEKNSQLKLNKSLKVQDLAKQLENNLQKKTDNEKKEDNGSTEVKIENGANVVNILENQQLNKKIKKKKKAKQFAEEENE